MMRGSSVTSLVTWLALMTWGWGAGCAAQRSIVLVHGILGGTEQFDVMKTWIQKDYPDCPVHALTCFSGLLSLEPMWKQLGCFAQQLSAISQTSPQGIRLVCYSQGGLICRGLLSTLRHNVDTFIALSSPLAGQFGDTTYLKPFFHDIIKEKAYLLLYTDAGQEISVANYWNDPHQRAEYLKYSRYLAVLNNETHHPHSLEYKANFLRLKNLILIGGPQDEIIGPWQSSHFGFYDSKEVVQPMTNQSWYLNDAFGLKTLEKSGRIHTYVVPGVRHRHWPSTWSVYQQCIRPWLA